MSEADSGLPETTEQALSLSKERLSTQRAVNSSGEQPVEAQAAADYGDVQTKGDAQSDVAKADFSFLADPKLRSAFEGAGLTGDVANAMKAWVADYTRKSQALSEYETKARAWDALEEMPGSKKAIAELIASTGDQEQAEVEEPIDLTRADNETIYKVIREEAAKLARKVAEDTLNEKVIAPVSARNQIVDTAKSMWPAWQDRLDEASFKSAWNEAVAHYGADSFNPQNTPYLFEPFLRHAASRRELESIKGSKTREADFAKRATSPVGHSTSVGKGSSGDLKINSLDKGAVRTMTRQQIMERFGWSESDLNRAASGG